MVQDYTRRDLSFHDDPEDAFRGLLLAFEKRFSLRTHMALPISDFARSPNWFCLNAKTWNDATQERMQRENANGQPFAPSWTWLSRVGPISYNTIPLNNMVDIEKGLEQMASQATDEAYKLPVTECEDSFCTMPLVVPSHSRRLASSQPLITRLHHADHVNLKGMSITVSQWLKI